MPVGQGRTPAYIDDAPMSPYYVDSGERFISACLCRSGNLKQIDVVHAHEQSWRARCVCRFGLSHRKNTFVAITIRRAAQTLIGVTSPAGECASAVKVDAQFRLTAGGLRLPKINRAAGKSSSPSKCEKLQFTTVRSQTRNVAATPCSAPDERNPAGSLKRRAAQNETYQRRRNSRRKRRSPSPPWAADCRSTFPTPT